LRLRPPKKEGICDIDGLALKQRDDDNPETIRHRFRVFNNETRPVIDYFRKKGAYVPVDGSGTIDDVYKRLTTLLDPETPSPGPTLTPGKGRKNPSDGTIFYWKRK
jgi:adenylate kinase